MREEPGKLARVKWFIKSFKLLLMYCGDQRYMPPKNVLYMMKCLGAQSVPDAW